jgi:hypothetical protein
MLYMFQAVPPPILTSSKLYTQHRVFVEVFLLLIAIVNELELTHDSIKKQKELKNSRCSVHSFEHLMMGGRTA